MSYLERVRQQNTPLRLQGGSFYPIDHNAKSGAGSKIPRSDGLDFYQHAINKAIEFYKRRPIASDKDIYSFIEATARSICRDVEDDDYMFTLLVHAIDVRELQQCVRHEPIESHIIHIPLPSPVAPTSPIKPATPTFTQPTIPDRPKSPVYHYKHSAEAHGGGAGTPKYKIQKYSSITKYTPRYSPIDSAIDDYFPSDNDVNPYFDNSNTHSV